MATKTETVKTIFQWDTRSVKSGGRDFKAGFSDLLEGERSVKRNVRELIGSLATARSGADLAAGAIFHLGESFKIGIGGAVGLAAAYAAFNVVQTRGAELTKEITDAQNGYIKSLRDTKYSSGVSDVKSLVSEREELLESIKSEKDLRTKLNPEGGNTARRLFNKAVNFYALGFEGTTKDSEMSESRDREAIQKQKIAQLDKDTLTSMRSELEIERFRASGNSVLVSQKERELKMELEIIDFKRENINWTLEEIGIIKQKYAEQERGEKRTRDIALEKSEAETDIANLRGTSGYKAVVAADIKVKTAQSELDRTGMMLGTPEHAAAVAGLAKAKEERLQTENQLEAEHNDTVNSGLAAKQLAPLYKQKGDTDNPIEQANLAYLEKEIQIKEELADLDFKSKQDGADLNKITSEKIALFLQQKQAEAELTKIRRDDAFQEQLSIESIKEETSEMGTQLSGQTKEAELMKLKYGYQVKINEAIRLGHTAEASALQAQQAMAEKQFYSQNLGGASQTSIQHRLRAMRRGERMRERHERQWEANGGLINVHRGINGQVIGGTDPFTGHFRAPGLPPGGGVGKTPAQDIGSKIDESNKYLSTIAGKDGLQ